MLIDSHCHLDFDVLRDDLDGVISRATAAGVTHMLTISTRVRQFNRLTAIVEKHDGVWCSVGTHPHNADEELSVTTDEILVLARHPKCIAIGEAGLDNHYDNATPVAQEKSFRRHISAARQSGLPLIIHSRDADARMSEILVEEHGAGAFDFVLHCYSSGARLARMGLELGGYISFSGIITFKNAGEIRDIARTVPLEKLLVETDAPYLAPAPHRGRTNEPAYVAHTAAYLAELLGMSYADFADHTHANFSRLFVKAGL
ncbi:MAG: TatD family hydrolase [Alphaproteobacteria bacterium]|nr:TatD family hydrolase [Alphaproteobacteria bacterium]